jgi:hypothetical protein
MKKVLISLLLAGSFVALSTMQASAVVCARGIYRAGCVGAGGAVIARRGVVVAPRRAVVVRRRCTDPSAQAQPSMSNLHAEAF